MSKSLQNIQSSYSNVGPTSVHTSIIARKKSIQRRLTKKVQFFGNNTMDKDSEGNIDGKQQSGVNGDSSARTYFNGIFPRMKFY
jgi:hypothetical protein